jgi:hypothetical protein
MLAAQIGPAGAAGHDQGARRAPLALPDEALEQASMDSGRGAVRLAVPVLSGLLTEQISKSGLFIIDAVTAFHGNTRLQPVLIIPESCWA